MPVRRAYGLAPGPDVVARPRHGLHYSPDRRCPLVWAVPGLDCVEPGMDEHRPTLNLEESLAALAHGLELIATRRLGSSEDGRDAAQETLVRVLERARAATAAGAGAGAGGRARPFADQDELARVAYGILRHVIADMHRMRAREVSALDDLQAGGPCPLERLVTDDERTAVHSALARLPDGDRALLERCYVHGERLVSIAEALGEPPSRIRKRKSRALERLATLLPSSHRPRTMGTRPASATVA